jgi:rhodanese-related sulfurtransferase
MQGNPRRYNFQGFNPGIIGNQAHVLRQFQDMKQPREIFSILPDDGYGLVSGEVLASALSSGTNLSGNDSPQPPFILDIRKKPDWNDSRIPGSVHCEWQDVGSLIESGGLPDGDTGRAIVVVCYVGQSSGQVTGILRTLGFRAYSLLDGFNEWKAAGYPVESPSEVN